MRASPSSSLSQIHASSVPRSCGRRGRATTSLHLVPCPQHRMSRRSTGLSQLRRFSSLLREAPPQIDQSSSSSKTYGRNLHCPPSGRTARQRCSSSPTAARGARLRLRRDLRATPVPFASFPGSTATTFGAEQQSRSRLRTNSLRRSRVRRGSECRASAQMARSIFPTTCWPASNGSALSLRAGPTDAAAGTHGERGRGDAASGGHGASAIRQDD